MTIQRLWLVGISLLLTIHALTMARVVPSSFFLVVSFCWTWVAIAALFNRLEAVREMAAAMMAISLIMASAVMLTPLGRGSMTAFYSLGLFPSFIGWICAYLYVLHVERAGYVSASKMDNWFDGQEIEQQLREQASAKAEECFTQDMTNSVKNCNDSAALGDMVNVLNGRTNSPSPTRSQTQRIAS